MVLSEGMWNHSVKEFLGLELHTTAKCFLEDQVY